MQRNIFCVQARLAEATEQSGVVVDTNTHHDMVSVIKEHAPSICQKHPPDLFPFLGAARMSSLGSNPVSNEVAPTNDKVEHLCLSLFQQLL